MLKSGVRVGIGVRMCDLVTFTQCSVNNAKGIESGYKCDVSLLKVPQLKRLGEMACAETRDG